MKNLYFYDSNGRIRQAIKNVSETSSVLNEKSDAYNILISDLNINTNDYRVLNNTLTPLPEKPLNYNFEYYIFDYEKNQWVDTRTVETQWPLVRDRRNALLVQSDWTQLPDVPLVTKEQWATYRQQLRDVTNQPDPFNIVWPAPPG